jgi:hypothetical protein
MGAGKSGNAPQVKQKVVAPAVLQPGLRGLWRKVWGPDHHHRWRKLADLRQIPGDIEIPTLVAYDRSAAHTTHH